MQYSHRKAASFRLATYFPPSLAPRSFPRIWCDYELYAAIMDSDKELDIVTMAAVGRRHQATAQMLSKNMLAGESAVAKSVREQNFPLSLLQHGLQVCLEDGEATVAKDKQTILSAMANHTDLTSEDGRRHLQENLKRANATLHSTFAILAWPQAMQRGPVQAIQDSKAGFGTPELSWMLCLHCARTLAGLQERW